MHFETAAQGSKPRNVGRDENKRQNTHFFERLIFKCQWAIARSAAATTTAAAAAAECKMCVMPWQIKKRARICNVYPCLCVREELFSLPPSACHKDLKR